MFKKSLLYYFLIIFLFLGCENQLRNLNGKIVKTSVPIENINPTGDGLTIDPSIPSPTMVTASQGAYNDKIRISWKQVFYNDAQIQYHVYRTKREKDGLVYERLTGYRSVSQLYYDDMVSGGVEPGVEYTYYVAAVNLSSPGMEISALSAPAMGYALAGVSFLQASFRESTEKITLQWNEVDGAAFYYVYRAKEQYEGVEPGASSFQRLSKAVTSLSYVDYSVLNGGELESGTSYYYYIEACFDRETVSQKSPVVRGALLTAGAPGEGTVNSVSSGDILNAIRVEWKTDANAESYRMYRITDEEYKSGNYVGTEIPLTSGEYYNGGEYQVWYDTDASLISGDTFYYRIAAVNDYGVGSLSPLSDSAGNTKSGNVIADASSLQPYVMLTRSGYQLSWNAVKGTDGFYVFAYKTEDGTAPADDAWGEYVTNVTANEVVITPDDLSLTGDQLAGSKFYFRVLPYKLTAVSGYTGGALTLNEPWNSYCNEIKSLLGEEALTTYKVGCSNFTRSVYFELNEPVLKSFQASKGSAVGTIQIRADLDMNSEVGMFYDVKLKRTCYYGYDSGVYPLSLPPANTDPGSYFPKSKDKLKAHVSEGSMKDYFNSGVISWDDPMYDWDASGKRLETKVVWDYATWDREAWKCILRKKQVDMNQFVKVQYELIVTKVEGETVVASKSDEGWPALSNKEFAHLAKWMTDCALNSIWQLNIPRAFWDKTVSWLPGLSFSHNGENKGRMVFNVGSVTNLSGSGGTDGTTYADWPGYGIKLSMSMKVSLESNQPRQVTLNGIEIETPLYSGSMDMQITVRDFGPFWGLWAESNGTYAKGGYVKVKNGNQGSETFDPAEIIMKGTGATDVFDYQVHGYDWGLDLNPSEKNSYAAKGGDSWHFTRINWPARPYPQNNSYMINKGVNASVNYGLQAWTSGDKE